MHGSLFLVVSIVIALLAVASGFSPLFQRSQNGGFHPVESNEHYKYPQSPLRMANQQEEDTESGVDSRFKQMKYPPPMERPQYVNFASPLLDYGYAPAVQELQGRVNKINGDTSNEEKPVLLYLPGFDGTYICPFIQFPELGTEFEVWCMTVAMNDRSTFDELKMNVLDFIDEILDDDEKDKDDVDSKKEGGNSFFKFGPKSQPKRPLYIAGESFGGILASEVALTLLKERKDVNLKGLTMINAATCYDRSQLASKGPSVYKLPALLYIPGLLQLLPLFTDEYSFEQLLLILQAKVLPSVIDTAAREAYMGRVAFSLPTKLEFMPPGTLEWRLTQWLVVGCERMESKIREFQSFPNFPTLVIAGEKDLTLPSIAEAERLASLLPKCQVHVVEGAGHASTCGSRMDMAALLRNRFPELLKSKRTRNKEDQAAQRTAMKEAAAQGTEAFFGMEPRYDGADIGLNPLLYWTKDFFLRVSKKEDTRRFPQQDGSQRMYKKASYTVQ